MFKQHIVFADATDKSVTKYGYYEGSSEDSGFLSGDISEEIQYSGLLETEYKESNLHLNSGVSDDKQGIDENMLIDSGVCLLDNFSKLSVSGQNNLGAPDKIKSSVEFPSPKLEGPLENYQIQDEDGDTYLHMAIKEGFVDVALNLIKAAPQPQLLEIPNKCLQTPLHLAVATGQASIARWLVVAGVDPCPRGGNGNSPLHIAALKNDPKSVQAIAQPVEQEERDRLGLSYQGHVCLPCDFEQWNSNGQTCVHVAAIRGHVEVLTQLVWYGADINAKEGCSGYTALHYAVKQRDEALMQYLIDCKNIDLKVETYAGNNVLVFNKVIPASIRVFLRNEGVPSPYPSDTEDSETEMYGTNDEFNGIRL
nr:NF-kappa-B inhibitor cactus-like [Leptinotarsa decemlineata]